MDLSRGQLGQPATVSNILAGFHKEYPGIHVSVEYLSYDSGSEERIAAAKTFIRYLTENNGPYTKAVQASSYWPVRDTGNIYENDMLMTEYSVFMPYMGDYYQITPGWTEARTAWWQLLGKIGAGTDVAGAVKDFPAPY